MLVAARRRRLTPKAYHVIHADWEKFIPLWRGPATKNFDGYAKWMVARRSTDPVRLFRSIFA